MNNEIIQTTAVRQISTCEVKGPRSLSDGGRTQKPLPGTATYVDIGGEFEGVTTEPADEAETVTTEAG